MLDFVNDVFIGELLFNITKYMQFADRKEFYKHAYQKADELMKKLKEYHNILVASIQSKQNISPLSSDAYKRYKTLAQHEKIACLITEDDLKHVEMLYARMKTLPEESKDYSPEELA